jgi:predicted ester cyclase
MGNKQNLRRILTEAFGQGRIEVLDEMMTEGFINHSAPPGAPAGIEGVKRIIAMERRAFPDFEYEVLREVEEGNYVVQHTRARGTHLGEIFGVRATGRRVEWEEMHIARVENGRCAEHWACNDRARLWLQIGLVPPPRVKL